MGFLIHLDHQVFYFINHTMSHPWLDATMPTFTDLHKVFWAKALLLPALLAIFVWRERLKAVYVIFCILFTFTATDIINSSILKFFVERSRPTQAGVDVILRSELHTGYSFPSSHAANMFGLATLLSLIYPKYRYIYFFFATMVAFSRVYVGVHFPADVIAGAFVGGLAGAMMYYLGKKFAERFLVTKEIRI